MDSDGYDECNVGEDGDDGRVVDCNDNNDNMAPGKVEICDGLDNDCDGLVDENDASCSEGSICLLGSCVDECVDNDNDSYDDCSIGEDDDDGKILDCNDNNVNVYPGALEMCDGVDNDCDGLVDENDGHCSEGEICVSGQCSQVACNDDIDCGEDGLVDSRMCFDGDVYQKYNDYTCVDAGTVNSFCDLVVSDMLVDDCNNEEICLSGNCVDECEDNDNDSYDDCSIGEEDDDGKILDCNDGDNRIYPNALEVCDGLDNDCDGQVDEGNGQCSEGSICSFGECTTISCYDKFDCGNDGFIDGLFCGLDDNVEQNYLSWTCENPGSVSSSCTSDVEPRLVTECSDSCVDGSCVSIVCESDSECDDNDSYTKDSCVNPGELISYCEHEDIVCLSNVDCDDNNVNTQDSCVNPGMVSSFCSYDQITCFNNGECGEDGFIDNLFCNGNGNDDVYQNYLSWTCENRGTVSSSCTQTIDQRLVTECEDSCVEGSCVNIVCENDNDCGDFDPDTIDICVNPGSVSSFCTHDDIECGSDNDCGVDRYTGGLYCQGDDLYRNFVDNSCNLPGDVNSFCSSDVDGRFVHECRYACSEGSCIRCNDDSYCDDGSDSTVDSCKFAGTINSYCTHESVQCGDDLDCGVDGYVGQTFCRDENVYQNYRSWMCMNPGTVGSFCDSDQDASLIEVCSVGCDNGRCVEETECNNGFDDDSDDLIDAQDPGCWDDPLNPGSYNPSLDDESRYDVECSGDDECVVDPEMEIYCDGNSVYQDTSSSACENPGTGLSMCVPALITELVEVCGNNEICTEGQCIQVACDLNSDCGVNGFTGERYCEGNDVFQDFESNICIDGGTVDSVCTLSTDGVKVESCGDELVCDDGECVEVCFDLDGDGYDSCDLGDHGDDGLPLDCNDNDDEVNPGENDMSCNGVDNDCNGLVDEDYVVSGTSCGVGECGANGLLECVDGDEIDSCVEGVASEEVCDGLDNDCDGLEDESDDPLCEEDNICLLGSCVAIACDMDSDCGSDGFVGSDFCSENDRYQNYREFSCSNPGTISSSCGSSTEPRLKEVCSFDCSGGLCVGECNLDSECDDDFYSEDYCRENEVVRDLHDFGCVEHFCVEDVSVEGLEMCSELCENGLCVDVECNLDSECGEDGFEGETYCQGDDVYQNYRSYMCLNAGTSISMCSDDLDPTLVEECENGCENGVCITEICDNGIDDDGDGLIDGLIEDVDNDDTLRVSEYPYVVGTAGGDDNDMVDLVVDNADKLGIENTDFDALQLDKDTADVVCNLIGYDHAVARSLRCNGIGAIDKRCGFTSPHNNDFGVWDESVGDFKTVNAHKVGNRWLQQFTCEGKLTECSNFVDDDGDEKIDYCNGSNDNSCDDGCASPEDVSEVGHDPECESGVVE
tara:strand:- start:3097 stop:7272 length:4176 start_codon:yes stop_codon:yes gene_type:complete